MRPSGVALARSNLDFREREARLERQAEITARGRVLDDRSQLRDRVGPRSHFINASGRGPVLQLRQEGTIRQRKRTIDRIASFGDLLPGQVGLRQHVVGQRLRVGILLVNARSSASRANV